MEKKKTSIRIAQESRKKNNKTGYFIGYITVMNGMSAFALAVAWCWGMSAIFHMEMDTKMILLWLLLISMLFSAGYGMSRIGGIGAGLGAAAAGIWYKWDICVRIGREVFGQLREGAAGNVEHLYQNIEMDTISILVLMLPFLLVLIVILYEGKGRWAAAVFIILQFVCAGCMDEFPMTEMGVLLFNGGMYFLTGMIAADRTASGDITRMVQIRMELRRLIRGGIGLAVLLLVAFGSGKQLNVVKEEKDGWYMTARNTVRERLDETIADAKERLTGQKTVRAKEESEKKKEAQKAAKSTAEPQKAKSTDDADPARLKRKLPVLETTGASGTTDKSGTANSILKDEIGNLNQITGFVPDDSVAKSVTITYRPESTVYVAERYGVFYEDDTWKDIEHSGKDDEEEMWEHMEDYLSCPTDLQKLTHYYIEEIGGIDGEWKDSKSEIEAIRKKICEALWELAVYDTEPGATPAGKDFVEYFLFENRKGFCVHFASAGTLLFRLAGKEARYAEGYAVPASAFEEQEDGTYQAQISGAMGHAWCQVWCLDDGYWENVEVTPPAGIEQIQKSVEEMKLPKGRLARILYQNAGWLKPAGGILTAGLMLAVFYLQGKKRCLALKKRVGKMTAGELYGCVLRVAKIKGIKMAEPTGQSTLEILKEKFPEITAEQWEKLYGQVLQELFGRKEEQSQEQRKEQQIWQRKFYSRFSETAERDMNWYQKILFRSIFCMKYEKKI